MQRGPAAARAVSGDRVCDTGLDLGARQGVNDEAALELVVGIRFEMLQLAASARTIVRAKGSPAHGAGADDIDKAPAIAIDFGGYGFAFERQRDKNRLAIERCNSLPAVAEALDGEGFDTAHCASDATPNARRSSTAARSGMDG